MNILHITDFHYSGGSKRFEQEALIKTLVTDLEGKQVDFIVFSGDLVNNGTQLSHFYEAKALLLDGIANALNVSQNDIFICPGNHDIDRTVIPGSVKTFFLEHIKDQKTLSGFISNKNDFSSALSSSNNYLELIKNKFIPSWDQNDISNELYSIHKRVINNKNVVFLSINTAWSCLGDSDYSNLFFPRQVIDESINIIDKLDANIKIIVMHHPFSWLRPFNADDLEDVVYKNFDLILSGHVHVNDIATHYRSKGIFCHTSPASLTHDKVANLGYSILTIDEDSLVDLRIERSFFNRATEKFSIPEVLNLTIPCGDEKLKEVEFLRTLTKKRNVEIDRANELLLSYDKEKGFLEMFNEPVLRTKPDIKFDALSGLHGFQFDKLLSMSKQKAENYIIYGKDKYGKTSLLKKLQINWLFNYSKNDIFPLYIDAKEYINKTEGIDLLRVFTSYYEMNARDSIAKVTTSKLYLLIDNYEPRTLVASSVNEFLSTYPTVSFIFTTSQTVFKTIDEIAIPGRVYNKLFINDLSRKEIRTYTQKTYEEVSTSEVIIDRIVLMCREIQLPANYWTISMILFIYKESKDNFRKNIFDILDLVIDKILNKGYLVLTSSKFSFKQYKQLCSTIAHDLLLNHGDSGYRNTFEGLLTFIGEQNSQNPRIIASNLSILNYLITCGMLIKDDEDLYTFRLNGFFEYFLAYYMQENKKFRDEISLDDNIYMSFKNEFEIYSSLVRDDVALLDLLYEKTKRFVEDIKNEQSIGVAQQQILVQGDAEVIVNSYDALLVDKISEVQDLAQNIKHSIRSGPLSPEKVDDYFDATSPLAIDASVKIKPKFDVATKSAEIFERYLSILARVFRNSDEVKDIKKEYEIFNFLLDSYSDFTFYLIDNIEQERKKNIEEAISERDGEDDLFVYKILSNFTPTLVQMTLNESLGHFSLENLICKKIDELKKDASKNQYQLFLLYFTLIDQDISSFKTKQYLSEIIELTKLGILRTSITLKLSYYLTFKSYGNSDLETTIRDNYQLMQVKLHGDKIDPSGIQKRFADIDKNNRIKRLASGEVLSNVKKSAKVKNGKKKKRRNRK